MYETALTRTRVHVCVCVLGGGGARACERARAFVYLYVCVRVRVRVPFSVIKFPDGTVTLVSFQLPFAFTARPRLRVSSICAGALLGRPV